MKWIITIFALMLLVTACSTEAPIFEGKETVNVEDQTTVDIEVRFVDELFDPNTITVNEGDTVKLHFLVADQFIFSLPGYGIFETVNGNNYLEFVADKEGVFDFSCDDCANKPTGVLNVV
ncbi:cupredoxin domain-containing protein [Candidatus Woesearchaeota archaeon]|nr:cupredoxin domain-containing protein [Candidatus Woesearchaeota archaeon]